jgi:hypothetical protein
VTTNSLRPCARGLDPRGSTDEMRLELAELLAIGLDRITGGDTKASAGQGSLRSAELKNGLDLLVYPVQFGDQGVVYPV